MQKATIFTVLALGVLGSPAMAQNACQYVLDDLKAETSGDTISQSVPLTIESRTKGLREAIPEIRACEAYSQRVTIDACAREELRSESNLSSRSRAPSELANYKSRADRYRRLKARHEKECRGYLVSEAFSNNERIINRILGDYDRWINAYEAYIPLANEMHRKTAPQSVSYAPLAVDYKLNYTSAELKAAVQSAQGNVSNLRIPTGSFRSTYKPTKYSSPRTTTYSIKPGALRLEPLAENRGERTLRDYKVRLAFSRVGPDGEAADVEITAQLSHLKLTPMARGGVPAVKISCPSWGGNFDMCVTYTRSNGSKTEHSGDSTAFPAAHEMYRQLALLQIGLQQERDGLCRQRDTLGCSELFRAHYNRKDLVNAADALRRECQLGNSTSCYNRGLVWQQHVDQLEKRYNDDLSSLLNSKDGELDRRKDELSDARSKTKGIFSDACTAGSPEGCHKVGLTTYRGNGRQGDRDALTWFIRAAEFDPSDAILRDLHATALQFQDRGELPLALRAYRAGCAADYASSCNSLAWVLATSADSSIRNGQEAVASGEKAISLNPGDPNTLDSLAAAYAEVGRFNEAAAAQQAAIDAGATEQRYKDRLALYQQGKPYHQ